jgi:DNA-binding winged helix-turn-helix (wHTH) protein/TolB-like protein/Flp pilus assembly protein TadD
MSLEQASRRYRFATYRLDTRTRELLGSDGAPLPLTAKAFDVLVHLIEARDRVVGRDELLGAVWAGRVVEENTLTQAIAALRRAFGSGPADHRFIVTVPGRGYRFVADVEADDGDTEAAATRPAPPAPSRAATAGAATPRRPLRLGAALLLALVVLGAIVAWRMRPPVATTAANDATLAVLPFRPLSTGPRDDMLALGLADTLITRIGNSTKLRVRSLASSQSLIDPDQDPLDAGRKLGARYIVEGTTQRNGERVRVSARMLDVGDGRTVWSGTFDERIDRVFTLQDRLASALTDALTLTPHAVPAASPCDGANAEAYRAYLAGRYQLDRPDGERMRRAIASFKQAIDLDPTCARAYAGIAYAYRAMVMTGDVDPHEAFPLAKAAVARALAIDPKLAEAHSSQGFVRFWYDWDWAGAEASFKHAIALNPSLADAHLAYAHLLANLGRTQEAVAPARKAHALNPLSPVASMLTSFFLVKAGLGDEAQRIREQAVGLDPDYWVAMLGRGDAASARGDHPAAIALVQRGVALCGDCSYGHIALANAYVAAGDRQAAERVRDKLDARARTGYVPAGNRALVHLALGDRAGALDLLERAYRERDARATFLRIDARWQPLAKEPRFHAILTRMNFDGPRALDAPQAAQKE